MTKIKLCGLSRPCDIEAANLLKPDYVGFVFAPKSRRYVTPQTAASLKELLDPGIQAVGVFTDENQDLMADLLNTGVIDLAQLHGNEDEAVIRRMRERTDRKLIQAFRVSSRGDLERAEKSSADEILLDAGAGDGIAFDWTLLKNSQRRFFLAGGLTVQNVGEAVRTLQPFGVDVSSGIETGGVKDPEKMAAFVAAVREEDQK